MAFNPLTTKRDGKLYLNLNNENRHIENLGAAAARKSFAERPYLRTPIAECGHGSGPFERFSVTRG
jgi:hypothetical protein